MVTRGIGTSAGKQQRALQGHSIICTFYAIYLITNPTTTPRRIIVRMVPSKSFSSTVYKSSKINFNLNFKIFKFLNLINKISKLH